MHPARGPAMNNVSITDSSGQAVADKKDYCDSANTDSGFHSGHNLNSSEDFVSEERNQSKGNQNNDSASPTIGSSDTKLAADTELDSGMIPDEELESRNLGLMDICERFDRLMKRDWMKNFQQDEVGETQLHLAVYERNEDHVSKLVTNVPQQFLNIQNDYAQTALHLAVLTVQPRIVRRLLTAGINQTIRDMDGNTALHLACGMGQANVVKELLTPSSCFEHLPQGASTTKVPQDLELWNYDGKTCVHLAAEAGSIEALRCLINAGADINAREGKSGMSALHISIEKGNEELANFLLDECPLVRLEAVTYAGMTAYQLALIQDKRILIGDLTKHGAVQISPPSSDDESDTEDEMMSNYYGASAFSATFSGLSAINVS